MSTSTKRPPRSPGELGPFAPSSLIAVDNPYFFPIGGLAMFADNAAVGVIGLYRMVIRDRDRNPLREPTFVWAAAVTGGEASALAVPGGGFGTILSADPAAPQAFGWYVLPDASGRISVGMTFATAGDKLMGVQHPRGIGFSTTVTIL